MKKNKLLVEVTTTTIYQYLTNQPTADLAFDEYMNQSGLKLKRVTGLTSQHELHEFIINKPKEKKK